MSFYSKNCPIPGVILAGGMSSRMGGGDKSLLRLGEKSILDHVIFRLAPQVNSIALNANGDTQRFSDYNLPVISDSIEGFAGPLAGVRSGLDWAAENGFDKIITVAADTPFFPRLLVDDLSKECLKAKALIGLAVTQSFDGSKLIRHPTFGLWSVSLKEDLRTALNSGLRKVVLWSEKHEAADVLFESSVLDPFFNVNTQEDLELAKKMI